MIQDILIAKSIMETESGDKWTLCYYVHAIDAGDAATFALRVDKREMTNDRITATEITPAFSDNFEETRRLAQMFADGQVTPGVLIEMCDEWI